MTSSQSSEVSNALPTLYHDILEIILSNCTTFAQVAGLCRTSKAYVPVCRSYLYDELNLSTQPNYTSSSPKRRFLFHNAPIPDAKDRIRRKVIHQSPHLWPFIKSLALTLDDAACFGTQSNTRYSWILQDLVLPNLEHLHLQLGQDGGLWKGHFRIVGSTRRIVERLLASHALRSFTIDILTGTSDPRSGLASPWPFPKWIFLKLSPSVIKVEMKTRYSTWAEARNLKAKTSPTTASQTIENSDLDAEGVRGWDERTRKPLQDLTLSIAEKDSFERCAEVLSSDVSHLKRLELEYRQRGEQDMWRFIHRAAGSLEELTLTDFPSTPAVDH